MVVIDRPERREVSRPHGGEEVLPPATLQAHQAQEAPLDVSLHHLQAVGHVRLVENPRERKEQPDNKCRFYTTNLLQICLKL